METKSMTLADVAKEIAQIAPVLRQAFQEAGASLDMSQVTVLGEGLDDRQKAERIAAMNERLQALAERKAELEAAEAARSAAAELEGWAREPTSSPLAPKGDQRRDWVHDVMARREWLTERGKVASIDIDVKGWLDHEVKTVISTGAGFAPQAVRTGIVVPEAFQSPAVIDLVPIVRTAQNAYVFMEQTTRTNAAAETAESTDGSLQSLPESAFAWTQRSETVRKVGHFVPVTDEQLDDIEGIEDILRNDMILGVRQRLSSQILNGNGTAPNLSGLLASGRTGVTDVTTTGDFIADAVDKLIENVRTVGFTEPTAVVLHPAKWHSYRRATTVDGIYIAGSPSENVRPMMWGLPVVLTTEIASTTAVAGNFRDYTRLAVKRGVEVSISSEHASYFIQGVKAIKAEVRAAFAVLREEAFAKTDDL